jgi:DNA processing protein
MDISKEQRDWLTLTLVPGVGSTLFVRLLSRFKTPGAVLCASEAELAEVVGEKRAQRIRRYRDVVDVDKEIRALNAYDAGLITMDDPEYPTRLAEIYDPPLALYHRGDLQASDDYAVAIVGTRKASVYGQKMAEKLGRDLAARGITVVSGLAAGIDAAAHQGALSAGGRTIAVLGCGVDLVFPAENAELMHTVIQKGCVLSCFAMGMKPLRGNFPQRNRIISGLSMALIVVEAPPGSGALITARNAADQGREIFAVPGRAGERNSMGPHSLLREGARLVETAEDILAELPMLAQAPPLVPQERGEKPPSTATATETAKPAPPTLRSSEQDVLAALSPDGSYVDEISLVCRMPVSEALSTLTMLELKGLVQQFSGKRFARA